MVERCTCKCEVCERGRPLVHCHVGLCKIRTKEQRLVDDACNVERGLTRWEEQFIESCRSQVEQGAGLSPLQVEKLEEILDERA